MRKERPSVEILQSYSYHEMLQLIELAGRTCYKSTPTGDLNDPDWVKFSEEFCKARLSEGHTSIFEHVPITVRFVCDRGVSHEIVRHRVGASYSQESTRYCVAGSTLLGFKNTHYHMTIKDLFESFSTSSNGSWKRMLIKQVNEDTGEIIFSKVKGVFMNGVKDTFKIKTSLGYTLECTDDHEVYTPEGYRKVSDLDVGEKLYVNGIECQQDALYMNHDWLYHQSIALDKTFVQIADEFNFTVSVVKKWARKLGIPKKGTGYFHIGRTPWNKGLNEADPMVKLQADALRSYHYDSSKKGQIIMKEDTVNYQKHKGSSCIVCNTDSALEVHHKDKNRKNNRPENLVTLCSSCHQRVHSRNLLCIHADTIVSIEHIGEQEVYDLEMDSKYHNFIANGVAVHNCNYSKDKFDNEISVIDVRRHFKMHRKMAEDMSAEQAFQVIEAWTEAMENAERSYMKLIDLGATPQFARGVLPTDTKTEMVMTLNITSWRHFFDKRCPPTAHPAMRYLAIKTLLLFIDYFPVFFEDQKHLIYEKDGKCLYAE